MKSNQVCIIGGATYIGTSLMKSLHAMTVQVQGFDINHHGVQRYQAEWQNQNCPLTIDNQPPTSAANKIVFAAGSDYLIKNENPTHVQAQKLITLSQVKYPHAQHIYIIMPFNKHEIGLSEEMLIKYFGKRDEDLRVLRNSELFMQCAQNIQRRNPHAKVTYIYISDVYGHKMPISPNHALFYTLTHHTPILRQNQLENYFPTHVNDVLSGLIKIIFSQEQYDHVALVNPRMRNFIQSLPHHSRSRDWHLSHDYTINTRILEYTRHVFPWSAKHVFNYRPKDNAKTFPLSDTHRHPSTHKSPPKRATHQALQIIASITAILTLCGIPLAKSTYDYKQLEKSLAANNVHASIEYAQSTSDDLENIMWLLTIFQQRETAEDLIKNVTTIPEYALHISTITSLRKEGISILGQYLAGDLNTSQITTWQQKVDLAYTEEVTTISNLTTQNPYILGYMTRQSEHEQVLLSELHTINLILSAITSEENSHFSVEIIHADHREIYEIQQTFKGTLISHSDTLQPLNIQINGQLLAPRSFNQWLTSLADQFSTQSMSTLTQLIQAYDAGHIRIQSDGQHCNSDTKNLCIVLNTTARITAEQQDNQLTLTLTNLSPEQELLTISSPHIVKATDIQDKYLRELDAIKTSQLGNLTVINYARPKDTSSSVKMTVQLQDMYNNTEVYLPIHTSPESPSRLYIPLK